VAWDPATRARLIELVDRLDEDNQTILTCCRRVYGEADNSQWVEITDWQGPIVRIPARLLGDDPRATILRMVMVTCELCGTRLLDGESGVCGSCEASETMGLLRLWRGTR
jgi:hypothetical protein